MSLAYIDHLKLPHCSINELRTGPDCAVFVQPPGTVRRALRYAPEFIDDPDDMKVFDLIGAATYRSPPVSVASIRDGILVGYRTIIKNGRFFNDESLPSDINGKKFLERLASEDGFLNEETNLKLRLDQTWACDRDLQGGRVIDDFVAALCSTEPGNYGSFLFRTLPKLVILRELGFEDIPVLVWAKQKPFIDLLVLLGVRRENILTYDTGECTKVSRMLLPSLRNPHAFVDRKSWDMFQGLSDRFCRNTQRKLIYVSRLRHGNVSGYATRKMTNEQQLIERLLPLGFHVVEPELLSMEDQVDAFSSADLVVGPAGSALFNVVFCRPGTKLIDIESEPNWIYAHAGLFSSCQLRYGLFMGMCDPGDKQPVHRRWSVNIDALVKRIESFLRN